MVNRMHIGPSSVQVRDLRQLLLHRYKLVMDSSRTATPLEEAMVKT